MKKFKGFTLIELIVVIAIIGVLAAILVPAMMGWVRKASINSANSNAKSIFTNAQTIAQEAETAGSVLTGDFSKASTDTYGTDKKVFAEEVDATMTTSNENSNWAVRIDKGIVTAAVFSNNGATYVGGYPHATPTDEGTDWDKTIENTLDGAQNGWDS